jgi:hypothetical protein
MVSVNFSGAALFSHVAPLGTHGIPLAYI